MHSQRTYRAAVCSDSTSCRRWAQETSFGGRSGELRDDLKAKGLMGIDVKANVGLSKRKAIPTDLLKRLGDRALWKYQGDTTMGRQITVDLVPLLKAGCTLKTVWGAPSWLSVTLPDGRVINSDAEDCLSFDCRDLDSSPNGWVETWLRYADVPHISG